MLALGVIAGVTHSMTLDFTHCIAKPVVFSPSLNETVPMTIVTAALARVVVENLDAALPLYERLSGATPHRFNFRDVELAWVGSFLLLSGDPRAMAKYQRAATLIVSDMQAAVEAIHALGGDVIEGPSEAANGPRMIAQHPDGAIFEYIQPR